VMDARVGDVRRSTIIASSSFVVGRTRNDMVLVEQYAVVRALQEEPMPSTCLTDTQNEKD
jgi:hypothetical protein